MRHSCSFTVGPDHPSLPGHFPGNPVVPGVLILEEVMRTVAGRNVRAVWSNVKFIGPVFPGERVDVHWDPLPGKVRFECRVSERVVAMGTFEHMMDKMA